MGLTASWLGILDDNATLLLSPALALLPCAEDGTSQRPGTARPPSFIHPERVVSFSSLQVLSAPMCSRRLLRGCDSPLHFPCHVCLLSCLSS